MNGMLISEMISPYFSLLHRRLFITDCTDSRASGVIDLFCYLLMARKAFSAFIRSVNIG